MYDIGRRQNMQHRQTRRMVQITGEGGQRTQRKEKSLHWLPVRQWICQFGSGSTSNSPNFVTWLLLPTARLPRWFDWSAHTVSLACCDHPHRSLCQFRRTTWILLLVVSLLLLRNSGTLFHWTVELLHPLTHLRSILRHFSLIRHNRTVARASVLWRDIDLLIDWMWTNFAWCWSRFLMVSLSSRISSVRLLIPRYSTSNTVRSRTIELKTIRDDYLRFTLLTSADFFSNDLLATASPYGAWRTCITKKD